MQSERVASILLTDRGREPHSVASLSSVSRLSRPRHDSGLMRSLTSAVLYAPRAAAQTDEWDRSDALRRAPVATLPSSAPDAIRPSEGSHWQLV